MSGHQRSLVALHERDPNRKTCQFCKIESGLFVRVFKSYWEWEYLHYGCMQHQYQALGKAWKGNPPTCKDQSKVPRHRYTARDLYIFTINTRVPVLPQAKVEKP